MLELRNIDKAFPSEGKNFQEILKNISLTLNEGETLGLLGESGCGKSTLANIICGLTPPDCGEVIYKGTPLYSLKGRYNAKAGREISLISQQPIASFDPKQKFEDALAEVVMANKNAKNKAEAAKMARELFETVGLEIEILKRRPREVSGGQAQRAAIARSLCTNPRLLIADEATSMLDLTAQARVINLLKKIKAERGLTLILITHDTALAEATCDRIYTLKDKNIFEKN